MSPDDIPIKSDQKPRYQLLPYFNLGISLAALGISLWSLLNGLHDASVMNRLNRPIFNTATGYAKLPTKDSNGDWRTVISIPIINAGKSTGELLEWGIQSIQPSGEEVTGCKITLVKKYALVEPQVYAGTSKSLRWDATIQGTCKAKTVSYLATLTIDKVRDTDTGDTYSQRFLFSQFNVAFGPAI